MKSPICHYPIILAVIFSMTGCVTPKATIQGDVFDAKLAQQREISVLADPSLEDQDFAKRLASIVSDEAAKNGYKISKTPETVGLILLPTITRMATEEEVVEPIQRRDRTVNSSQGLMSSTTDFQIRRPAQRPKREVKTAILVTAIPRAAWGAAPTEVYLPKAWSVLAITSSAGAVSPGAQARALIVSAAPWFGKATPEPVRVPLGGSAKPEKKP